MNPSELTTAACHCGNVVIRLSTQPTEVFECNCSICRKLGVLWAYYTCDDVTFAEGADATRTYVWNRKIIEFHSCGGCGCTTHWIAVDRSFREKMGVNARLINGLTPADVTLGHINDGGIGWYWTQP